MKCALAVTAIILGVATHGVAAPPVESPAPAKFDSVPAPPRMDFGPVRLSLDCGLDPILLRVIAAGTFLQRGSSCVDGRSRPGVLVPEGAPHLSLTLPDLMSDAEYAAWQRSRPLVQISSGPAPNLPPGAGKFQFNIGYKF